MAFASRFLTECERKYAINELELLGVLWGLENFRYYVYGKKSKSLDRPSSITTAAKMYQDTQTIQLKINTVTRPLEPFRCQRAIHRL